MKEERYLSKGFVNCGLVDMSSIVRMSQAPREAGMKCVDFYRAKLGKQTYCVNGSECRDWVWETPDWRVYVNNNMGVAFEVRVDLTDEQALEAWRDYASKIGFEP